MPDPGDTNLARLHFWKERTRARAGTFGKERWNPDAGDEIALSPFAARAQLDALRFFCPAGSSLANYLALSRKRIRHCRATI